MRRILAAVLALAALAGITSAAAAQEPAKYNFASIQGSKDLKIKPGDEGRGYVYFYNIDGNRITHVTLEISQAPAGWQVEIQPPLAETQVEVNGEIVFVTENLYIEPSAVLSEEDKNPPEGMLCIPVPQRGFALAKEARIIARVPATEEIGATGEITISATARWLGQSGAAAVSQNRDFTYTVEVVSEKTEFEEKIIGGGGIGKWWPAIAGGAVVIAGSILGLVYIRKRRE